MDFYPSQNVETFHGIPRFGFSDNVAVLFTGDDSAKENYLSGLFYFCIGVMIFSVIWLAVLFALKVMFGVDSVGCAAGGEPIDVSELRENGVRRWERRQRMERSWKIQNFFIVCCMGIPAFSAVLINRGLDPVMESLVQMSETASAFGQKANQAMNIVKNLSAQSNQLNFFLEMDLQSLCPSYLTSEWARESDFTATTNGIKQSVKSIGDIVDGGAEKFVDTMLQGTQTTNSIENGIDEFGSKEWICYLVLLVLNVSTTILLLGAILTKNKANVQWFQLVLANVILPTFFFCMVGVILSTCIISSAAVINADFCAASEPESPIGTLREFSALQGYDADTLLVRSIYYYAEGSCEGTSPFSFVEDISVEVADAIQKINFALEGLTDEKIDSVGDQCGADAVPIARAYSEAVLGLESISKDLQETLSVTTCDSIRPLLEDLVNGVACTDSVDGFTWMFSALSTIVVLSLTMLTTRAALFNPLIPSSKSRRREKEFKQYKKFMEEHGYDTTKWLLDPKDSDDRGPVRGELPRAYTFETEDASSRVSPISVCSGESSMASGDGNNSGESALHGAQSFTFSETGSQASSQKQSRTPVPGAKDRSTADDDGSVYSADSDDSSIHPPPSVVGSLMSSVSSMVSNLRKTPRHGSEAGFEDVTSPSRRDAPILTLPVLFQQYHEKVASYGGNDDRSISECSGGAGESTPGTPKSTQDDPLLLSTKRASKKSPRHSSSQPAAPQKSMSTLPRTIVNV